ncbi:hypothetical protein [Streptomyces sp. NPDC058773]
MMISEKFEQIRMGSAIRPSAGVLFACLRRPESAFALRSSAGILIA